MRKRGLCFAGFVMRMATSKGCRVGQESDGVSHLGKTSWRSAWRTREVADERLQAGGVIWQDRGWGGSVQMGWVRS